MTNILLRWMGLIIIDALKTNAGLLRYVHLERDYLTACVQLLFLTWISGMASSLSTSNACCAIALLHLLQYWVRMNPARHTKNLRRGRVLNMKATICPDLKLAEHPYDIPTARPEQQTM